MPDLTAPTEADLAALGQASAPGLPAYPYGMLVAFSAMTVWDHLGTAGDTAG